MGDAYPRTGGCFRRLIDLRRAADSAATVWLEDDFHHFGITLEHDGAKITAIRVEVERLPYGTCPMAAENLQSLVGHSLSPRCTDVGAMIAMRRQCTHMFDACGLAMAHAASGRDHRRYEAIVSDREIVAWEVGLQRLLGPGEARLLRDGAEVLAWRIDKRGIAGPDEWAGQAMVEGFRARTESMPVEAAEAATVLRRAVMVAAGRTMNPDLYLTTHDRGLDGVCFTFLEENRDRARRVVGSAVNYEAGNEGMLSRLAERP